MLFKEEKLKISEKYRKEKEEYIALLTKELEHINKFGIGVGEGKTAEVKRIGDNEPACLKIIDKNKLRSQRISLNNGANQEIDYLDKLSDTAFLESIGIKEKIVPGPIISTETGAYGFLVMEYIDGASLEDLLKSKNAEKIPSNMDWENFFEKLEVIIKKLNKANFYHRDLHAGNIMVDNSGNPIIIDFGLSCESFYSEDDPYHEESVLGTTVYKTDLEHLKELKTSFIN